MLKKKIRTEFNHLSVMSFDELNFIKITSELKKTYNRLLDFNEKNYKQIIDESHKYALSLLDDEYYSDVETDREDILEYVMTEFNPVTGYLYKKEAERKRLRQGEEMATARELGDRYRYRKTLAKSSNLWFTQSLQYAIDIEDYTVLKTLAKNGVKKVQWVTKITDNTCDICRKRDGKVYDIDKVPCKPHYYCKCSVLPYKNIDDFI